MSEKVLLKKDIALSLLESGEFEKDLIKQIHSESYYEFFKQAYAILLPGEPYSDNWHIKYLCDILQKELERIRRREIRLQDIIINIPFRSAKSLICTVCFPVWCWTQDQSIKLITTSYAASLALEHALASRSLIMSEWFKNLYGDKVQFTDDQNAAGFYKIKGGGFRKSVGIGGQITGSGADIILCLPEGQKIMTDQGELNIEDIVNKKLNIKILTHNHSNGHNEYKEIVRYDKNPGRKLIKIKTKNGKELICTEEHEVWTENRGYIKAKDLLISDILLVNE